MSNPHPSAPVAESSVPHSPANSLPPLEVPALSTTSDFSGLQSVALCQLKGFSEDALTRRSFEWRYRWLMLSVIPPVAVAVWILAHPEGKMGRFAMTLLPQPGWDVLGVACLAIIFGTLGIFFGATIHAINAVPKSRLSGRRMLRFEREDAPNGSELIYVDPESRTYFCRVIRKPS